MYMIINISKKAYDKLIRYGKPLPSGNTFHDQILNAVANGIPLPKGCGDLIDRNSVNQIVKPIDDTDDEWVVTGKTAKKLIRDAFDKADKETSNCE